ncbi:MAG: chromosome segregation protein SMC [Oscillospiraceae bacterium]|nr:chromosome segregation protein SMC [Oscillospiraceae bacterium]
MLLKSLEVYGFKSFANRTKLTFNIGLTAVIGPNGSGKSNISDSIRWVLGEQSSKSLRGGKMEDVIFSGSKNRKAIGYAEVSLEFDNKDRTLSVDSDQVVITRKYYRSSESEYKINGENVRLKDIHELLMDTGIGREGYSIIGQGKISEIVSAKSDERREIFEEASGITKFRYKKNEAEKKLYQAEENMIRLMDILNELECRVKPLRKQSEKAKEYLALFEKKKKIDISIWIYQLNEDKKNIDIQDDKIIIANDNYRDIVIELESIEEKINNKQLSIQNIFLNSEKQRMEKSKLEENLSSSRSNLAVLKNENKHSLEILDKLKNTLDDTINLNKKLEKTYFNKNIETERYKSDLLKIIELVEKEKKYNQELSVQLNQNNILTNKHNDILNDISIKKSKYDISIENSLYIIDEIEDKINNLKTNIDFLEIENNSLCKEKENLDKIIFKLEKNISILVKEKTLIDSRLKNMDKNRDDLRNKFNEYNISTESNRQKLDLLENYESNFEGYNYSVKYVMGEVKKNKDIEIYGTISQIIEVDNIYSLAIETSLGGSLQNIVVDNDCSAKLIIEELKSNKMGRVTILPISTIKPRKFIQENLDLMDGYIGVGSDLIINEKIYDNIIKNLLGNVAIVKNLEVGYKIASKYGYSFKIVTLDGQVINFGGSFTGGSSNIKRSFLGRKNEIISLKKVLIGSEKKHNFYIKEISLLEDNISIDKNKRIDNQNILENLLEEINIKKLDNNKIQNKIQNNTEHIQDSIDKLKNSEKRYKDNDYNIKKIKDDLLNLEEIKNKNINSIKFLLDQIKTNTNMYNSSVKKLNEYSFKKMSLEKDISVLQESMIEISENINNNNNNKLSIHIENQEIENKFIYIKKSIVENIENINNLNDKILKIDDNIKISLEKKEVLEKELFKDINSQKTINLSKEGISREIIRLEEHRENIKKEYNNIISLMWDEYEITQSEGLNIECNIKNINILKKNLVDIKASIKKLGHVNIDSIEEYKEVSDRYNFLKGQIDDIEKSKKELFIIIDEVISKMKEIFQENFNKINSHFMEIFISLFGGGSGELRLIDPNNVLESGIEIYVQPPGKIIKNLVSLSGGEQSLVAICIYFAILKVKPSPFCVLDEIEAALDDANVCRYAQYLKNMSNSTQFIAITHRRGTMEEADILYGVTMQQEGVSCLLELDIKKIESIL